MVIAAQIAALEPLIVICASKIIVLLPRFELRSWHLPESKYPFHYSVFGRRIFMKQVGQVFGQFMVGNVGRNNEVCRPALAVRAKMERLPVSR